MNKIWKTFYMKRRQMILIFGAICSAYALTAEFFVSDFADIMQQEQLYLYKVMGCINSALNGKEVNFSILTIGILFMYFAGWKYCSFDRSKFVIVACFLSVVTILYYPYTFGNSLSLLFHTEFQVFQTIIFLFGFFELFHISINVLYVYIERIKDFDENKEVCFWKIILKLALLWFPHVIVKFPGAFCPDSRGQLRQGLGLTPFNAHHPPFHSWLLGVCASFGNKLFHSYNIGVFVFILIQYSIMVLVFGHALYYLEKKGGSKSLKHIIWMIYCICPFIIGYIGVVLKDILYSTFCFAFIQFLVIFIDNKKNLTIANSVGLIISSVLAILTRNNGKEVIYPTVLLILVAVIYKNKKNVVQLIRACMVFVLPIIISFSCSKVLEVCYDIQKGGIQEALSFPFQQTARTVLEHSDELPEEEKEIIDRILRYDTLAERYRPDLSDPVKGGYTGWDKSNMIQYAKVWVNQFFRYPMTYCEATLSQNYYIFCLFINKQGYYHDSKAEYMNQVIAFEYAFWDKIDRLFEMFYKAINKLPVLNLISNASFWCIMLLVFSSFVWIKKEYDFLIILCPLWLTMICIVLGPVYAPRYTYPFTYSLPFLIGYFSIRVKEVSCAKKLKYNNEWRMNDEELWR